MKDKVELIKYSMAHTLLYIKHYLTEKGYFLFELLEFGRVSHNLQNNLNIRADTVIFKQKTRFSI